MRKEALFLLLSLPLCINAQNDGHRILKGEQALETVEGAQKLRVDQERSTIDHIRMKKGQRPDAERHLVWLKEEVLSTAENVDYRLKDELKDKLGFTHFRYQQTYRGFPVLDGIYYVHVRDGRVVSANGGHLPGVDAPVSPTLTAKDALQKAKEHIGAERYRDEVDPEYREKARESIRLIVIQDQGPDDRLAYEVDVYAKKPLSRHYVYVDARSGAIIDKKDRIWGADSTGTAETMYYGNRTITADHTGSQFRLRESGRGSGIETYDLNENTDYTAAVDFTDADNYWDDTTDLDDAAYAAHWGTEKTYDYYSNVHGRNSYDGAGSKLLSYVHYDTDYTNAFWDGQRMTYGDGGSGISPLTSIDIVAHEITHGVTQHTANLDYSDESGALNESFSDIFGVAVNFYARPSNANYQMGEDIGMAFRDVSDPKAHDDPDTYQGQYWHTGSSDNGGVHTNSGVQNYWFYLLTNGGASTNDNGDAYNVTGIGMDKAADIAYRNLSVYLTSTSDYSDARYYSIEAAKDLYGECSQEVVSTTNAWYAVGVGSEFSDSLIADFSASKTYGCSVPTDVTFTDLSTNANTHYWSFGDGDSAFVASPTHSYDSSGTYTVSQVVEGDSACGGRDTLSKTSYITVVDSGAPPAPVCAHEPSDSSQEIGVHHFGLRSIARSSPGQEGYVDKTCGLSTTLTEGKAYSVDLTTSSSYREDAKLWIDLNGDRDFDDSNELVYDPVEQTQDHDGSFIAPEGVVYDSALRMRVGSDVPAQNLSPCDTPQYGQFEDYTVKLHENDTAPIADLVARDTAISVGDSVEFEDMSLNLPTDWDWEFPGAVPSNSSVQDPTVAYNSTGTFPVTLVCSNSNGADTLTRQSYISVTNEFNICADDSATDTTGVLYDSGGETGPYSNSENCGFLISPDCGDSITLSFQSFHVESGYDELRVYEGNDNNGTLLATLSGTAVPPPVTAQGNEIYLEFDSDHSVTYDGFEASWETHISSGSPPTANMSVNDTNPPVNTQVAFDLQSSPSGADQFWSFGDGTLSYRKDPSHVYSDSGTYTVTAVASNCFGSDTVTQEIVVQAPPELQYNPDTIEASVTSCGDSITDSLWVENLSGGDLTYEILGSGNSADSVRVLALTYGADTTGEYPNTIDALEGSFSDYSLSELHSSDSSVLRDSLHGKQVLLVPEQELGPCSDNTALGPVIQDFTNDGGSVVFCGTNDPACLNNTGLFSANYQEYVGYGSLSVVGSHTMVDSLGGSIDADVATYTHDFTSSSIVKQVSYNGNYAAAYKPYGHGELLYIGYDYNSWNSDASQIIGNAVRSGEDNLLPVPDWISLSDTSGLLASGDSDLVEVGFSAQGMNEGTYEEQLILRSNDPGSPDTVTCIFHISGEPSLSVSDSCLSYPTIMARTDTTDTLTVHNGGCDTLSLTSLYTDSSVFSLDTSAPVEIMPWDSMEVGVTFAPDSSGSFSDTLRLRSNDGDLDICLDGSADPAPDIHHEPDTLEASITSCGDSTTLPLDIINQGAVGTPVDLEKGANVAANEVQVLALTYGTDYGGEYTNTINALDSNFKDYELSEVNTTDPGELADSLEGKHVFLIPEQSGGSASVFSNFAPKIQSFASDGGTVIHCGTDSYGTIFNTGLFSGSFTGSEFSGVSLDKVNSHPIVDSVPSFFISSNGIMHYDFTGTDAEKLVEYSGDHIVTHKPYGNGHAIYLGYDFYDWDDNASQLIAEAVRFGGQGMGTADWISLSDTSGNVGSGDSLTVDVTFSGKGMTNGTYEAYVLLRSDDPNGPDTVPCIFHIDGDPELQVRDSCVGFSSILVGDSAEKDFFVGNNGCDSLNVNDLDGLSAPFSVDTNALTATPGDSAKARISFDPASSGSYSDSLIVRSNGGTDTICLEGIADPVPNIEHSPSGFDVDLDACGDSTTRTLTLSNTGGAPLHTNIDLGRDSVEVLALTYGTDYYDEYQGTIDALDQEFRTYSLSEVNTTDSTELSDSLSGKDLLILPDPEYANNSDYTDLAPAVRAFARNGGTVIACGTDNSTGFLGLGIFHGSYSSSQGSYSNLGVVNDHPLTKGLSASPSTEFETHLYRFTDPDTTRLLRYASSEDAATLRPMGTGMLIYLGYDYGSSNNDAAKLIGNAVEWGGGHLPDWLSPALSSDTIPGGGSRTYSLTFDSKEMSGGTYTYRLPISSNDPDEGIVTVPCTLNVSMDPCADFSYDMPRSCNGELHFTDTTKNNPTSWEWDFGDGGSSYQEDPVHSYSSGGNYQVSLIACNSTSCDTVQKTVTVPTINAPKPPSCRPSTSSYYCCYGITKVQLAGISNSSQDASEGYRDFSCDHKTTVTEGESYQLTVETGQNDEHVRAWIDLDNSGTFDSTELVLDSSRYTTTYQDSVYIPYGAVTGKPLRMRVLSDDSYSMPSTPDPCHDPRDSQAEDYAIEIKERKEAPVPDLTYEILDSCEGTVHFKDRSTLNATSWEWHFGDGNSSLSQDPYHTYQKAGVYTVTLIASNSYGSDTLQRSITIDAISADIMTNGAKVVGNSIQFFPDAPGAITWSWALGDSTTSTQQYPTHSYSSSGWYEVELVTSKGNDCKAFDRDSIYIEEETALRSRSGVEKGLKLYPNPNDGTFRIRYEGEGGIERVRILDTKGRTVFEDKEKNGVVRKEKRIVLNKIATGIYSVRMKVAGERIVRRISIQR